MGDGAQLPEAFELFWRLEQYLGEGYVNSWHCWSQAGDWQSVHQLQKATEIHALGYAWGFF